MTQEMIDEMFAEMDWYKSIENDYWENEFPKVCKLIAEWSEEFPLRERREMRRRYLLDRIRENKDNPETLKRLVFEAKVHIGEIKGMSPESIEQARRFPITKLIKSRGFMAKCPFHKDDSPSLNLKNNFFYCHGCHAHGDVIEYVMKVRGLSFRDAIGALI